MPRTLVRHQRHALVDGPLGRDTQHTGGHHFPDRRRFGRLAFEYHLAGVVPLRDDADELVVMHHQQRADAFIGHDLERVEDGVVGPDGPDVVALRVENLPDCFHACPLFTASLFTQG